MKKISFLLIAILFFTSCDNTISQIDKINKIHPNATLIYKIKPFEFIIEDSNKLYHIEFSVNNNINLNTVVK